VLKSIRDGNEASAPDNTETYMYIDDCTHTFEELAHTVLPAHMTRLAAALESRRPMSLFGEQKVGPVGLARRCGILADFPGCYVLIDGEHPVYVGISRKVLSRLRQHVRGRTHFDASLAYRIAQRRHPTSGKRATVMNDAAFKRAFEDAKAYLAGLQVSFVQIENPLELYVFEAYAAMSLHTYEWNTFRTH
jgi:hypothetical protein